MAYSKFLLEFYGVVSFHKHVRFYIQLRFQLETSSGILDYII